MEYHYKYNTYNLSIIKLNTIRYIRFIIYNKTWIKKQTNKNVIYQTQYTYNLNDNFTYNTFSISNFLKVNRKLGRHEKSSGIFKK